MSICEIKKNIYWVGEVDFNIRNFHGPSFHTPRGTSYNAYLIVDEKITLIDIVDEHFCDEFIENINKIVDVKKIDYVVINHVEPDHSGSFPHLMKHIPNAKVFCSQKGKDAMMHHYFGDYKYETVKTGDEINLGKNTIKFIEAPLLHWPDSMFSYIENEKLLFPNDAFGQHIASSKLFDDEHELMDVLREAKKYYANILMPMGINIIRKIKEINDMGLEIDMIAPSHGLIWRTHYKKIIEEYLKWADFKSSKKAVIVYETMWNSTFKMARALRDGLESVGVDVKFYKASISDANDIMSDILDSKALLFGSSTINNTMLADMAYILEEVVGLRPRKKIGLAFGSYGWGKGAVRNIEEKMKKVKIELIHEGIEVKYVPTNEDLRRCYEIGVEVGEKL